MAHSAQGTYSDWSTRCAGLPQGQSVTSILLIFRPNLPTRVLACVWSSVTQHFSVVDFLSVLQTSALKHDSPMTQCFPWMVDCARTAVKMCDAVDLRFCVFFIEVCSLVILFSNSLWRHLSFMSLHHSHLIPCPLRQVFICSYSCTLSLLCSKFFWFLTSEWLYMMNWVWLLAYSFSNRKGFHKKCPFAYCYSWFILHGN